jgi:hypothetical protein
MQARVVLLSSSQPFNVSEILTVCGAKVLEMDETSAAEAFNAPKDQAEHESVDDPAEDDAVNDHDTVDDDPVDDPAEDDADDQDDNEDN